ncbi:MAG: ABC transporter ATP-binding protein/permease [Oscillospiraceae bacterium]|jgi:putative ABC transport system permease protein|nr:ABC transporter ATP-binding protein/permease [Oscillospiraceae bacterium]
MLQLKNITKVYSAGGTDVHALRGLDLSFRESEFVSVLGPSGCGKTTLLNIVGGLDHYTEGDLIINGKSTKDFKDGDWDAYRNNSVGFVFQSYNLIPHQNVISNVELALTLSGVSKAERAERAKSVLERVGLGDQLYKKPNQLSGGQMQRVAIARALINDPDILLADEPTGALDSETSTQVMELLRAIAADKLVIMVTHNPDLADTYSTRIIRLLDGRILSDSDPITEENSDDPTDFKMRRTSMSFGTAVSLSFKNLLTKKARTILTAFAGSIGIIGIALIMSLSNGLQTYIDNTERDTLSSYPITIEHETMDLGSMIQSFQGKGIFEEHELNKVYANTFMAKMMNTMMSEVKRNDLAAFKQYIQGKELNPDALETDKLSHYTTAISYSYNIPLNLYHTTPEGKLDRVHPGIISGQVEDGMSGAGMGTGFSGLSSMSMTGMDMWRPLIPNRDFLAEQYEVVAGKLPENYDEAVLIVTENNEVPDILLYSLGLKTQADYDKMMEALIKGEVLSDEANSYEYSEILSLKFPLILPADTYAKENGAWVDKSGDKDFMFGVAAESETVKIVGILRPNPDAAAVASDVFIGYTTALMEYLIDHTASSEIVKEQLANPEVDVFTGLKFEAEDGAAFETMDDVIAYINSLPDAERQATAAQIEQAQQFGIDDAQLLEMMNQMAEQAKTDATYDGNIKILGVTDLDHPSAINIYASSFENKDAVADFISEYNKTVEEGGEITYTDFVGLLMSSITTVINAISIVLIAFVSISLVVSSIMIGIITYISVLERTREIGVLRSIGASKRDISRVFNAETLIIGFSAGLLGIVITAVLCIPANAIVLHLTDIPNVALLPSAGAVALVLISMFLTFIAGLLPSRMAARKDPVVALRTE